MYQLCVHDLKYTMYESVYDCIKIGPDIRGKLRIRIQLHLGPRGKLQSISGATTLEATKIVLLLLEIFRDGRAFQTAKVHCVVMSIWLYWLYMVNMGHIYIYIYIYIHIWHDNQFSALSIWVFVPFPLVSRFIYGSPDVLLALFVDFWGGHRFISFSRFFTANFQDLDTGELMRFSDHLVGGFVLVFPIFLLWVHSRVSALLCRLVKVPSAILTSCWWFRYPANQLIWRISHVFRRCS